MAAGSSSASWQLRQAYRLRGHEAPVLSCTSSGGRIASGAEVCGISCRAGWERRTEVQVWEHSGGRQTVLGRRPGDRTPDLQHKANPTPYSL